MKTLIHTETKRSKYIWNDNEIITFGTDRVHTPGYDIGDLNASNAQLIENVTPPEDWVGNKYLYDNGTWTIDPAWKE